MLNMAVCGEIKEKGERERLEERDLAPRRIALNSHSVFEEIAGLMIFFPYKNHGCVTTQVARNLFYSNVIVLLDMILI